MAKLGRRQHLSAFWLFNLVRSRHFVNARVNRVASVMLLVYLVHENFIVRQCVRPAVWLWIRDTVGYDLLFAWLALYSLALFAVALVLGVMYTKTLGKRVDLIGQGSSEASGRSAPPSWTGVCALH